MQAVQPRKFDHLEQCDAISRTALASHLRLYAGYVAKYNSLMEKLYSLQRRGPAAIADLGSLKGDIAYALGAIKNHELYFDGLGIEGQEPVGELAAMIVKNFHSMPQYLVDLKHTALHARGWVWTVYDFDLGHLANYDSGVQGGLPVWNAVPILAIDLYGHAYFYDFGNNKTAYVETVMKSLNWTIVAQRLAAAQASRGDFARVGVEG